MLINSKKTLTGLLNQAGVSIEEGNPWGLVIHDDRVYNAVLLNQSIGLGESYMKGWWDADDVPGLIAEILSSGIDRLIYDRTWAKIKLGLAALQAMILNPQSLMRSKRVIDNHYEIGDRVYEATLDPLLQYTCAYYGRGAKNLNEAQRHKLDLCAEKLGLERLADLHSDPNRADAQRKLRVLDIGCGWGGLAKHFASEYGVQVTGLTISQGQLEYAQRLCRGLSVDFVNCDYREYLAKHNPEPFDLIISVGMLEHVGSQNYQTYFDKVYDLLKDGGTFLLHHICISDDRGGTDPWLNKYIFHGGELPTMDQILTFNNQGKFRCRDMHQFGKDYERTLEAWLENFDHNWEDELRGTLDNNGNVLDERFRRMWRFYLMMCMGTFLTGRTQLIQTVWTRNEKVPYQTYRSIR